MKNENIKNGVKIINVEGKDIKRGYSFLDRNEKLATYKFKGNFDYSLGLIKLEETCKEKGIDLYEEIDGNLYSKVLVCLKFTYSNKNNDSEIEKVTNEKLSAREQYKIGIEEFDDNNKYTAKEKMKILRAERDKLIKEIKAKRKGEIKQYKSTLDIENNPEESVMLADAKKVEIEIALDIEVKEIKADYRQKIANVRADRDNSIKDMKGEIKNKLKQRIKEINHSLTRNGIREELYSDGFEIDGKLYVRYLRSSGSARVGKCIFILQEVYEEMIAYSLAGNEVVKDMELDLPSWEAYLGLTNTALEDTVHVEAKNILLVDDVYSKPYTEECMVTELIDGKLHTEVADYEVSNSLFDGSSLIDYSLLDEEYALAGGVQLRQKWYKGFSVACSIQQFFKEHKVKSVNDLNGWTIAEDISDVKLICTKSSIKYLKINKGFEGFQKWLNQIDNVWGICGHPHESKFVGGEYVQGHYQLLNNIQLSEDDIKEVAKESKQYAELLKNDLEVFKMHIKAEINTELVDEENPTYDEFSIKKMTDSNKFMNIMIQMNDDFAKTKVFKRYRKDIVDNFIDNCKRGHLLIYGCYAVVIMNSIDYLYHAIDRNWKATKEDSHMEHKTMMCDYFDYDQELLCSRSPMPVQGNILIAKNVENEEIKTYFSHKGKLSPYIMHINAIENNCCERGSGFDSDGDKFLLTNNSYLLRRAKVNYEKFLVPVNNIKSDEEIKYCWNNYDKAILDERCSQNNIGRIINDSMILVSEYWHRINNGETHENLLPLYKIICELSIMSNVAIDACKRPVPYEEEFELARIENCTYFRDREIIQIKVKDNWKDKNGKTHNKTYVGKDGKKKQAYKKDEDKRYILKDKKAKVRPNFFKLVGQGEEYSFQHFNCSMDYLQKAMKVSNAKPSTDVQLHELFSDEANVLNTGKAQNRDINAILGHEDIEGIIESLSKKISAINLNDEYSSDEKNEKIEEAKGKTQQKLREIRKGKGISDETLIAIIKRLDKDYSKEKSTELTNMGRLILSTLYGAYQYRFIKLFSRNTKPVKQLIEDEKGGIQIFNRKYKKVEVRKDVKMNFLKK